MPKRSVERSMFYGAKPRTFEKARELRSNMTVAEKLLWNELKKKKLCGYRFKAQHPISKFIADFYCHKFRLVIEIDGEIHAKQKEYDIGRTAELNEFDINVIRFSNNDVYNRINWVMNEIEETVKNITCKKTNK